LNMNRGENDTVRLDYEAISDDSLNRLIENTREELRERQDFRMRLEEERRNELKSLQVNLNRSRKELASNLCTTRPQSIHRYMSILRHHHGTDVPPTSVLQLEATLLRAMHMTFTILPDQEVIIHENQEELCKYLSDQLDKCTIEKTSVETRLVEEMCHVAQRNTQIYAAYQNQLEELQTQVRHLSKICCQSKIHKEDKQYTHFDDMTLDLTSHSQSETSYSNSQSTSEDDAWFPHLSFSKLQDSFLSFASGHGK